MNKEILYHNKKIFYRIIGSGDLVILIHGFGEDGEVWKNQIEFLKNNFQLIVPDLPGSGKSEMIDDMSIEEMADVIHFIIQQQNINVCTAIGHSMGGYITLAFAEKYINLLNAFGLFHSTAYPDNEERKMTRRKGIEFIKQRGAYEFLKNATPNLFSDKTKNDRPAMVNEFISSLPKFSADALISYHNAMMRRPDRTEILNKTILPVLFIIGEYDNAIPLQDSLKQCHLPEKSYIHIMHQSGHMSMLEEIEKSNEALEMFLSEIH